MAKKKRTEWRVVTKIPYFNHALRFNTEEEARTWIITVGLKLKPGTVTIEEVEAK